MAIIQANPEGMNYEFKAQSLIGLWMPDFAVIGI
jgi:hypothetical protein